MNSVLRMGQGPQVVVVAAAAVSLVALSITAATAGSGRLAAAAFVGGVAGLALYHASFGFTGAWRRIATDGRGAGVRAQMVLIAATAAISFPLIAYGRELGLPAGGFVFPFGVSAALGAAMFGLGMQLGGGCGSGTLFTAGGGSSRMAVTLAAFIFGSVVATAHTQFWATLPMVAPVSLVRELGPAAAFAVTGALLAMIAGLTVVIERRRHGSLERSRVTESWLAGPWSMLAGALVLAAVGIATLMILGRPWGITSGFALWGAKIAAAFGVPVETWPYWRWQAAAIERSVFADATSVMNFGIILGAMGAAALAGRFRPRSRLTTTEIATATAGGLLMGYGARLSFGCNIGAFLGGVISGSLHGWGWLVFGFLGSLAGVRLRRLIGMDSPPQPQTQTA